MMINMLNRTVHDATNRSGKYPSALYIGKTDWDNLRLELDAHTGPRVSVEYAKDGELASRPKVMGLWVYVVDAQHHMVVA